MSAVLHADRAGKLAYEEAARWFVRLQNLAEDDYTERGRFECWLAASPVHASAFRAVTQLWDELDQTDGVAQLAQAADVRRHAHDGRRRAGRRAVIGCFLGVAAGAVGWQVFRPTSWQAEWVTRPGETRAEVLEDGSRLTLGGGSRVTVRYGSAERQVTLHAGMAAFEVVRQPQRPFVVDSGLASVTVLGTSFGVNRLEDSVRVGVLEGSVRVARREAWLGKWLRRDVQSWQLGAGQVVGVYPDGGSLLPRQASDELAWRDGALVFADAGLAELAATLSRYSTLPVRLEPDSRLARVRVAAVAQTNDIDRFLDALPGIAPVRVDRGTDVIWLRAD